MLLDQCLDLGQLLCCEPIVHCEPHLRLDPEFCFAIGMLHMNVHSPLLAREEVKAKPADSQNRRTHATRITQLFL